MLEAARAAHPLEACGLLFGRRDRRGWTIEAISVARNVSGSPATRFEVDPAHLFAVQRAARNGGPAAVGVWHSHPNGMPGPSAHDRDGVTDPSWLWLIAADGRLAGWAPDPHGGFRPVRLLDSD
jgi:proteasome lid subunit RPN8/RPN11